MDITICRGVPGAVVSKEDEALLPIETIDMVKVIRERGFNPVFEDADDDRRYVSHNAADVWLPILQFTVQFLIGTGGGLFSMLIWDLLGKDEAEKGILHVEERVIDTDGVQHVLRATGKGEDVLRALDEFEKRFE
jgi:hypothetical protein